MTAQANHTIPASDFWRATQAENCGNVGFIGLAPDGSAHHVVVPVDIQIARGVKACNRPTDGTPFGGYREWHYFECLPHPVSGDETADRAARKQAARDNAKVFQAWARGLGVTILVTDR